MHKLLKVPKKPTRSPVEYLAFQTLIDHVVYPIAVFKFNGKDAYCWDWMKNGKGYLVLYSDLASGRSGSFGICEESHTSYHESGTHHSRITGKTGKLGLASVSRTPVAQIQGWKSVASVPAPLTSALPWKMNVPEWQRASKIVTLTPANFGRHKDVYLRAYLCSKTRVQVLAKRFGLGSWILGHGPVQFVIAAEPV